MNFNSECFDQQLL